MRRHRAPYPPEFRAEAVRLAREGGHTPNDLAHDRSGTDETIRNWLKQADLDAGRRSDGLTAAERAELAQLRREVCVLQEEREILQKQRPSSPRRRPGAPVAVQRSGEGPSPGRPAVSGAPGLPEWGLCVAGAGAAGAGPRRRRTNRADARAPRGEPRYLWRAARPRRVGGGARHPLGRKRAARRMRAAGLTSVCRRRTGRTTQRDATAAVSDDLVQRVVTASAPDRL